MTQANTSHPLAQRLRSAGIQPTRQRMAIAQVLLSHPVHMSADEVLCAARDILPSLSRATVYNTLPVMVESGLLRALRMDADRTIYDSRTEAHSHIFHEDTGIIEDLPTPAVHLSALPALSPDLEMVGMDLIIRVRKRTAH